MEHTYRLTGTLSELQELLQSQFDMEEKAAKFSVCLLIRNQQQTVDELSETNTALWYLDKQERFTSPVFKSRFSISFTDAKKNVLEHLFIQFAGRLFDGDKLTFTTILNCLLALYRSGTYIKDEECCVYYRALNWKATHSSQEYFLIKDILPDDQERVCCHLDYIESNKWKCASYHKEYCHANEEKFLPILNELCKRNVLTGYDGKMDEYAKMYRFVI